MLGVLAGVAVLHSNAPAAMAWPLALAALSGGVMCAWREGHRPRMRWHLPGGDGTPRADGRAVTELRVRRRGPLTLLAWRTRHGRWRYRSFWPDTLNHEQRRELMLAAGDWRVSRQRRSMAP